MEVTVQAGTVEVNLDDGNLDYALRVYCRKTFVPSTGETVVGTPVLGPNHYGPEIPCTYDDELGVLSYSQFTLDSTTDAISDPRGTSYFIGLFVRNGGGYVLTVHKRLYVSDEDEVTTLADIVDFSDGYTPGGEGGGGTTPDTFAPSVPTGLTAEWTEGGSGGTDTDAPSVPTGLAAVPLDDSTAPSVPTGLASGAVTDTSVAISWAASSDTGTVGMGLSWGASTDPPVDPGSGEDHVALSWNVSTDTEGSSGGDGGDIDGGTA